MRADPEVRLLLALKVELGPHQPKNAGASGWEDRRKQMLPRSSSPVDAQI